MADLGLLLSPSPKTLQINGYRQSDLKLGFRSLSSAPSQTLEFRGSCRQKSRGSRSRKVFAANSEAVLEKPVERDGNFESYDAIVIGSGIGGLVAATQLAVKGARVLVLEKYVIPGGSSGYFQRDGYMFDVGSSVMFGFSDKGNLNLITQALAAVGCEMQVIPDPTTVHFHLPNDLSVRVHREYGDFITELTSKFPHEKEGIQKFYSDCWKIFNALNSLELKSLEEPIYLFGQFFKKPLECLTLAYYLPQNAGDIARKYIRDPQLLAFIDAECFIVSTVNALQTPVINASMVVCDRHFGGINYPVGGVGGIAKALAKGLVDKGSKILYKANVTNIILEHGKAVGVRLSDGRKFFSKTVISNATRWDTFGKLLKTENIPKEEENFQKMYVKAPSFLSIHMGVKADVLPPDTDCHHFVLEDEWARLEKPYGSIFLSIPTVLDPSLAPKGHHILHIFTVATIDDFQYRSFQGLTCLMQISTRTEDFLVDTLKLRIHIGPHLREVFKDPSKRKVMHGADRDILWLQRDFGIYVCNLFDTGQASRVLQLERNSLEYLLHHFCGVTANKEYQNADWRLRPLPDEMIKYAREDTHYLLHIYDLMRGRLLSASTESESGGDLLLEVHKRSYDICMQLYEKELLTSTSYLHIYGLQGADFNSQQLAIVAGLSEWRDIIAREEDESTGYILPNKALLEIARQMPTTSGKLHRLVRSKHPYVERNLGPVVGIIRSAITNAAAFENALEQLKKGRADTVREQIMEAAHADAENQVSHEDHISMEIASAAQAGSLNSFGNVINVQRAECMEVSANVKEESSEQASMNFYRGEGQPSISSSETVCSVELSQEARTESSHLVKAAAVASVQILKKPNRAFGAMLGHSVSKRKLDGEPKGSFLEKEKAEVKVEQIKSSVTLPFHSFSGKSKQPGSTADGSIKPCDLLHRETNECVHEPAEVAKLEDIIPLETGSNDRESSPEIPDGLENGTTRGSPSGSDTADEPTSLTDLASSFQNFFQSGNQKRNSKQERTQEADSCLLKPFDYAAARKQKRFGDSQEQKVDVEGGNDVLRAPLDSMESRKGLISGRARREETSREFPQARRRQAFPASGNRSATFR